MNNSAMPLKRKGIWGIIVLCCLILLPSMICPQLDRWELNTLSLRQQLLSESRASISPITLVSLDNKTVSRQEMNTLFGRFPWRRDAYALTVRFFRRSTPKSVLFDTSFNGGRDFQNPASDTAFVNSLRGSTGFASALLFTAGQQQTPWQTLQPPLQQKLNEEALSISGLSRFPTLQTNHMDELTPPLSDLAPVMNFYPANGVLSDLNHTISGGGTLRRWMPFTVFAGKILPHEPLGVLLGSTRQLTLSKNGVLSFNQYHVHLGPEGTPLIRWYGDQAAGKFRQPDTPVEKLLFGLSRIFRPAAFNQHPYPEYSLWDVIESELVLECRSNPALPDCQKVQLPSTPTLSPGQFVGQYVIIGETTTNLFDKHQSIYDDVNGEEYPGVYVVANILDNLMHDDFTLPAPFWINCTLFVLGCALVLWMVLGLENISTAMMGSIFLVIGHFVLTIYAYLHWNLWINAVYPITGMLLCYSGGYIYRYQKTRKTKEQLRFAFGKYVSPSVMQMIEKSPEAIKLGGQRQEMTMLFCDIRGFTTYSENNSPEAVQSFLTQYFSIMNEIILKRYSGTINKLIGDAIFAYWGFPLATEEHALLAVSAALAMQEAILEWQKDASKPPVNIGIGIHTGEVMVGNVGSEDFMDFTLIGDAVNTASRLEHLTKDLGVRVVISEATYERIKNVVEARPLGQTKIRGKETELGIFEPMKLNL